MSKRGTDFLYKWISSHVPETTSADIISVADLTQKLFADAKAHGINKREQFVERRIPRCRRGRAVI